MASHEGLLEVSGEPNPLLHVLSSEEVLSLLNELISAHLDVLVEEVAAEDLLAIAVVENVGGSEEKTQSALGHELHILVMEEDVVVVKEQELYIVSFNIDLLQRSRRRSCISCSKGNQRRDKSCHHPTQLLVFKFIFIHTIMGIQEHSVKRELRSNSLADIKKIEHLLD